jgi:hypothetical protein
VRLIDLRHTHSGDDKVKRRGLIYPKLLADERINSRPVDKPITHLGLAAATDAADDRLTFRR